MHITTDYSYSNNYCLRPYSSMIFKKICNCNSKREYQVLGWFVYNGQTRSIGCGGGGDGSHAPPPPTIFRSRHFPEIMI